MLLIDAANVVGSRPTGWWRDRAGAARAFVERVRAAVDSGRIDPPVAVVLEGAAREGVEGGLAEGVDVIHAAGSGDEAILDAVTNAADQAVVVVTADRALRRQAVALGADVVGPSWLLDLLDAASPRPSPTIGLHELGESSQPRLGCSRRTETDDSEP